MILIDDDVLSKFGLQGYGSFNVDGLQTNVWLICNECGRDHILTAEAAHSLVCECGNGGPAVRIAPDSWTGDLAQEQAERCVDLGTVVYNTSTGQLEHVPPTADEVSF